jgi:hypothetical protein
LVVADGETATFRSSRATQRIPTQAVVPLRSRRRKPKNFLDAPLLKARRPSRATLVKNAQKSRKKTAETVARPGGFDV